jgi:hypothetical protein
LSWRSDLEFAAYRDKKVVGVFVRFRAPLHLYFVYWMKKWNFLDMFFRSRYRFFFRMS